ncbi:PREDICTED: uncharacterized protein LOC109584878 [Amphimedon queenslandica]|uniref:MARVEL domain-containing protein n=1 Tax=Amphimedon queenslandica TaxID=400682 RepID=A0A1X7U3G2_AMPQE|nr:PREDICTED: uncharacterized protein LOC109584878 [Amphimedon queenslandica]|eukprot:XP_019856332.1 PREDICTED: uncharacterized protein LOC109584878 [Amphimedon queenslandica]
MPNAEIIKQILSVVPLAVLLLSLGAAGTSLGLLQANINNGMRSRCNFFISYTQAMDSSLVNYNEPTCKLSIASATIATICLALLTAIELIRVSFHINVKTSIAKIIQVGIYVGSILFLFITTIVVSAGWGKTCATYNNLSRTGITPNSYFKINCNGPQHSYGYGPYPPNGADFIAAAVFACVSAVLAAGALCYCIVKQMRSKDHDNELTPTN